MASVCFHAAFLHLFFFCTTGVFSCLLHCCDYSWPQFGTCAGLWFHLSTKVHMSLWCQPAVVGDALCEHCESSAWPQLSLRPRPKLTAKRGSWGCCQSESWVSNNIIILFTVLENLRPVWQLTKLERAWSVGQGSMCAPLMQHLEGTTKSNLSSL